MSFSFVGGYFLNPYVARFEQALNLAAVQAEDGAGNGNGNGNENDATVSVTPTIAADRPRKPYTLVKTGNVGYTAVLLFARNPDQVKNVQIAEVGFGAAEMGNKGAVGVRCLYESQDGKKDTELTFVATHLAAMEWNLARRNANWASIMRELTFENPEEVVERHRLTAEQENANSGDGERTRLLRDEHDEQHVRLQRQLHDVSVFKPSSHLFVAGDLNYRIATTGPPPGAPFPSLDPESEHYYMHYLPLDQLAREKGAGRTMHGLSEGKITFPPTYKYDIKPSKNEADPAWSFAPHRYPSWTDRVLYLDTPSRAASRIQVRAYDAMPVLASSDHRAVYLRASIPVIPPAELERHVVEQGVPDDPRVRLPVEIDPEAWERRAAARRREVMAGWSMMLWSTKEGALLLCYLLLYILYGS